MLPEILSYWERLTPSCTGKEEHLFGRLSAGVSESDAAHALVRRARPGRRGRGERHPRVSEKEGARLGRRGRGGPGPCASEEEGARPGRSGRGGRIDDHNWWST